MAANPFGREKAGFPDRKGNKELVKLPKDGVLKLSFGLYVHDGSAEEAKVKEVAGKSEDTQIISDEQTAPKRQRLRKWLGNRGIYKTAW